MSNTDERPLGLIETFIRLGYGVWSIYWGSSDELEMEDDDIDEEEYAPPVLAPRNPELPDYTQAPIGIRRRR